MLWLSGAKWFAQDRTVGVASAPTVSVEQYNRCERLHLQIRCLEVADSLGQGTAVLYQMFTIILTPSAVRSQCAGGTVQSLMFTCPQTGRAINAGVTTDLRSLESVQTVMMRLECPNCGMPHQFPIKRGYLAQSSYWPYMKLVQTDRFAKFACRPDKKPNQPLPNRLC